MALDEKIFFHFIIPTSELTTRVVFGIYIFRLNLRIMDNKGRLYTINFASKMIII